MPGGYAEYLLVPSRGVQFGVLNRVPNILSFEEASLTEPLSCCLGAQKGLGVSSGDTVVVVGGGPVGIMHCRLARANKAGKASLVEKDTKRLERVNLASVAAIVDSVQSDPETEIMALTQGRAADVVIIACPSSQAQEQSLSLAGKGGKVNFSAGLPQGQSKISIDGNVIHYREVLLQGSHGSTPHNHKEALDMLEKKTLEVNDLTTHKFPLDRIEEAFLFAENRKGMHIAIIP